MNSSGDITRCVVPWRQGDFSFSTTCPTALHCTRSLASAYSKQRVTFGKPIFEHQVLQFLLADMATQIGAARQLIHHAASLKDAGRPCL